MDDHAVNALDELRNRTIDIESKIHGDEQLIKWLQARDFNVDKAEHMLRKSLEWREENSIDSILDWTPPEVLLKYYPVGLAAHDKQGCPVFIIPYGGCDIKGLLQSASQDDYIRYTIRVLEASKEDMRNQSQSLGCTITQQCTIFDLDNFALSSFTWKPAMEAILQNIQIYEANYPELLKCAYVINAPRIFTVAYAMIKPFLHEVTIRKIKIFGRTGWKEALLEDIPESDLPQHWGGSKTDPDGDPKCPSIICLGGEVPKSYYLKKKCKKSKNLSLTPPGSPIKLTVGKGSTEIIKYNITEPNSLLRWEFRTDHYDIGFGIDYINKSLHEEPVVPFNRVDSHVTSEQGVIKCEEPGTYHLKFDNGYSYLRSKTLYYNVEIVPPDHQ